jgi:tetratricopeptide (TPR) repeat protein
VDKDFYSLSFRPKCRNLHRHIGDACIRRHDKEGNNTNTAKQKSFFVFHFSLIILFLLPACKDYVLDIEDPNWVVEDAQLTCEEQVPFLINGVKAQFSLALDQILVCAEGLSDAFEYARQLSAATFESFDRIDAGDLGAPYDNSSVLQAYNPLGEARFLADDLLQRTGMIKFEDHQTKNEALFTACLFGGITRYLYATYFGLNENEGGGVINAGPFIPAAAMYDSAIVKLEKALHFTDFDYKEDNILQNAGHAERLVHSLIARCYLYRRNYGSAMVHLDQGLQPGDGPFLSRHFIGDGPDNYFWQQAGANRTQFIISQHYEDYIRRDSLESARIKIAEVPDYISFYDTLYYQTLYPEQDSPITHISWQENHLMRAEVILRGAGSGDPLILINEVRASHGLEALVTVDLETILYQERDKELFLTGARLPDQRRFNKWHLPDGSWRYLSIPRRERDANDHF